MKITILSGIISTAMAMVFSLSSYAAQGESSESEGEEPSECVQKCNDAYARCAHEVRKQESLNYFKCGQARSDCKEACVQAVKD